MSHDEYDIKDEIIEAVKQQLESVETVFVKKTYEKLVAGGMSQEESILTIAKKLAIEIQEILETGEDFNTDRYKQTLLSL